MSPGVFVALLCGVLVAYFNGANDVSKGIATLAGSGVTDYRHAILWGTLWTGLGALASSALSRAMVGTFGAGLLARRAAPTRSKQHDPEHDDIDTVVASRFDRAGKWIRPPADLERQFHSQEIGSIVDECLNSLPLAHRSAFVLREVEGFSTAEIRKILNVTATNLGVMLFRARNRLRECVERKGLRRG